jgi:hypothetical protein
MNQKGGHYNGIYNPSYHPAKFIELAKMGYTKAQIAAEFDISRMAMWKWSQEYSEFEEAVQRGLVHMQAYAERILDKIAQGEIPNANATAQIFKMKSQFREDYQDTKYIKTDSTLTINTLPDDQLQKQIMAKLKMLSAEERAELLAMQGSVIEGEIVEMIGHDEHQG